QKGYGFDKVADQPNWHGKPFAADMAEEAIEEISERVGGRPDVKLEVQKPEDVQPQSTPAGEGERPTYTLGDKVATRQAYGDAIQYIGATDSDVVVLDAEVSNSTFAETMKKVAPERFFEMFIAEQQMISTATGLQNRGKKAFCSTFAAFFARAY